MSALDLSSNSHFEQIKNQSDWTLVDFWAPWCGPCQMMLPVFDRIADSFSEKITAAKANVDEHGSLAGQFGIRGVPTLVLLHKGVVVDQLTGAQPQALVENWLNRHFDSKDS